MRLPRFLRRKNQRHTGPRLVAALAALVSLRDRAKERSLAALRRFALTLPYVVVAVAVAATPVLIVYAYRYVTRASDFAVHEVRVEGNSRVSIQEVLETAGLGDSPNLLALDLGAVEAALVQHPWIQSATVSRELPDKLVVAIVEREPAALVQLGALYFVDKRGEIFTRAPVHGEAGLPVLTGLRWDDLAPDAPAERLAIAKRLIRGAIALAAAWKKTDLGATVPMTAIGLDPLFGYAITLEGGSPALVKSVVHLGRGDVAGKAERLATLVADAEKRGREIAEVRLDDERDPNRVAVRFTEVPPPPPEPKAKEQGQKKARAPKKQMNGRDHGNAG